jgi:anti-sigma factor RsiW
MMRCTESDRLQDYLDGELPAEAAARLETHVQGCERCTAELALYRRLYDSLALAPLFDPRPAVTERVLAQVLPSRVRRRQRIAALGWAYAGLVAASVAGLVIGGSQPGPRQLVESLSTGASRALVEYGLWVINGLGASVQRVADLMRFADLAVPRLAPLARALGALVMQPAFLGTVLASTLACALLLWWMRPRPRGRGEEVRHVGLLGF